MIAIALLLRFYVVDKNLKHWAFFFLERLLNPIKTCKPYEETVLQGIYTNDLERHVKYLDVIHLRENEHRNHKENVFTFTSSLVLLSFSSQMTDWGHSSMGSLCP